MTFANVLLLCLAGIASCAALVFMVETVVAFFLHEQTEEMTVQPARPRLVDRGAAGQSGDKAA